MESVILSAEIHLESNQPDRLTKATQALDLFSGRAANIKSDLAEEIELYRYWLSRGRVHVDMLEQAKAGELVQAEYVADHYAKARDFFVRAEKQCDQDEKEHASKQFVCMNQPYQTQAYDESGKRECQQQLFDLYRVFGNDTDFTFALEKLLPHFIWKCKDNRKKVLLYEQKMHMHFKFQDEKNLHAGASAGYAAAVIYHGVLNDKQKQHDCIDAIFKKATAIKSDTSVPALKSNPFHDVLQRLQWKIGLDSRWNLHDLAM